MKKTTNCQLGDHCHNPRWKSHSQTIKFGEKPGQLNSYSPSFLDTNYTFTFNLDVSDVLTDFENQGFFTTFDGTKIAKADFKGFYIAGNAEPLSWDFVNLANKGLLLKPTADPNIYSITVRLNPYDAAAGEEKKWTLTEDISTKPKYKSNIPLIDALYNLSLEEAKKNIELDSTLRTGSKWAGVWTRDVSYSTYLAFAHLEPEAAKISLRKKVKRGRIIQDTGSGGAWPISSDRTTWCLAAWEIYLYTGDEEWLNEIYPVIKNTLDDDYKTLYNTDYQLYMGESSFLDWREQTYPKWMDNKDIHASLNLGTNAVHYQAHKILGEMSKIKGEPYQIYIDRANAIRQGMQKHLYQPDLGFFAQYLYGRTSLIPSKKFEALGNALAVLFDVSDKDTSQKVISSAPLTEFGTTCIYPQIQDIPPYHNNAIWPFVQGYWNLASAKAGNEKALEHGLASIYRAAGLFLTNYENMVASTGDYKGTEINSDRMLWSMAANMAMIYRVFMGIHFQSDGIHFNPCIPKAYDGERTLENFKYRNATFDITVIGYGNTIASFTLDGKELDKPFMHKDAQGKHTIKITLQNNEFTPSSIHIVDNHVALSTPLVSQQDSMLIWEPINGAKKYHIYDNGTLIGTTKNTRFICPTGAYHNIMVTAEDSKGYESFSSEPTIRYAKSIVLEMEAFAPKASYPFTNYNGDGFIEISLQKNKDIQIHVPVNEEGDYFLDMRYSNGNGPWNTDNKCAIRSISVNETYAGVLVFPQNYARMNGRTGDIPIKKVHLKKGNNLVRLHFEDWNHNMNVDDNTAMIDQMRLVWEVKWRKMIPTV
ncbi:MAG: amylo-alpha-1,6-glucosidase [Saprospiraceae bacterium]